jgi:hypothetical protein
MRFRPDVSISGTNFLKHFDKVREMARFRIGKHRDDLKWPAWTPDIGFSVPSFAVVAADVAQLMLSRFGDRRLKSAATT